MKNYIKLSSSLFCVFAIVSCSVPVAKVDEINVSKILSRKDKYSIIGSVQFPEKKFLSTKATINQVRVSATVSLIYPHTDPTNPNVTIATGLSDSSGNFTINVGAFSPVTNQIYVLQASKRIGDATNALMTVSTYIKWTGSGWTSITGSSINISALTTGITIIDYHDSSISPDNTIGTVVSGTPSSIGSVTTTVINDIKDKVTYLLTNDTDPTRFIGYANSQYYLLRENSFNKSYLISNKSCPTCDLSREDLSSQNLSNSDLKNANLSNANLTSSNLTSANLTGATLTGVDLSNATWTNGTTTCFTGSIGKCIFPDFLVNTYTTNSQRSSSIGVDSNGNFVVTWQSNNQASGTSINDIYAQRYNSAGVAQGSEFLVNTHTTNAQSSPAIGVDSNGNFVVTWQSTSQAGAYSIDDIYAQRYNSAGVAQGSEFRVNTYTTNAQRSPSIGVDSNGNFVITWLSQNQAGSGTGYDIYAQRYNSLGVAQIPSGCSLPSCNPSTGEFLVNTYTTSAQTNPSLGVDSSGNFIVTWSSNNQVSGSSVQDIYVQRYNSLGVAQIPSGCSLPSCNPSTGEFRVNTYTTNAQQNPSIGVDSSGNFVVTWRSNNQASGTSNNDIYSQRYNSLGVAQGSEFLVNTYTTNTQVNSSVGVDSNGNFVITWQSQNQASGSSSYDIYAQRYNSSGTAQDSEFRVNTYTSNSQQSQSIKFDSSGNFIVSWHSYNQASGSNNNDIYLHKYNSVGEYIK